MRPITHRDSVPPDCLTPEDRALLNAVFGWEMRGAAAQLPAIVAQPRLQLSPSQIARGLRQMAAAKILARAGRLSVDRAAAAAS